MRALNGRACAAGAILEGEPDDWRTHDLLSPAATASGVSMPVIASPNAAAIISDEQNCRNERQLTPQALNRPSIVPRSVETTVGDPGTGIPQNSKTKSVCLVPKGLAKVPKYPSIL